MNPLYGGMADATPAYVHAIVSVLYMQGASRFGGGERPLCTAVSVCY